MNLELVEALLAFLPALMANPLAVVFGGGAPIDGGLKINGKRLLGDGKTWRGLLGGGISAGIITIIFTYISSQYLEIYPDQLRGYIIIFSLSFGALFGDMGGSVIKRRMGKKRGEQLFGLDQYDFVLGAFIFTLLVMPGWVMDTYVKGDGWIAAVILIIGIPILHRIVNIIGYELGLKKEPW